MKFPKIKYIALQYPTVSQNTIKKLLVLLVSPFLEIWSCASCSEYGYKFLTSLMRKLGKQIFGSLLFLKIIILVLGSLSCCGHCSKCLYHRQSLKNKFLLTSLFENYCSRNFKLLWTVFQKFRFYHLQFMKVCFSFVAYCSKILTFHHFS